MTPEKYKEYNRQAMAGEMPDEYNPAFVFSLTNNQLLSKIAKGEIDAAKLAELTLTARGCDIEGRWVGFGK